MKRYSAEQWALRGLYRKALIGAVGMICAGASFGFGLVVAARLAGSALCVK